MSRRSSVDAAPGSPDDREPCPRRAFIERARAHAAHGDPEAAVRLYELALEREDCRTIHASLVRSESHWRIQFDGTAIRLPDVRGVLYLARLVRLRGHAVPAHVLVADESEIRELEACWERLASTRAQLATAEESFDVGRVASLREALAARLDAVTALLETPEDRRRAESARVRGTRALRSVVARIEKHHAALGAHLTWALRTGQSFSYAVDPGLCLRWTVEDESS